MNGRPTATVSTICAALGLAGAQDELVQRLPVISSIRGKWESKRSKELKTHIKGTKFASTKLSGLITNVLVLDTSLQTQIGPTLILPASPIVFTTLVCTQYT